MAYWNQKTFCLITGASRGIGRCIAVEFSKKVGPNSVFLLLARSAQGLEETKAEVLANEGQSIQVTTAAVDLSKPNVEKYLEIVESALTSTGTKAGDFDISILVHNAGTLGKSIPYVKKSRWFIR